MKSVPSFINSMKPTRPHKNLLKQIWPRIGPAWLRYDEGLFVKFTQNSENSYTRSGKLGFVFYFSFSSQEISNISVCTYQQFQENMCFHFCWATEICKFSSGIFCDYPHPIPLSGTCSSQLTWLWIRRNDQDDTGVSLINLVNGGFLWPQKLYIISILWINWPSKKVLT